MDTSSTTSMKPALALCMRVRKGKTSLDDFVETYPDLERRALDPALSLSDSERRLILDLQDFDDEAANLSKRGLPSRENLIAIAVADAQNLSLDEARMLKDRFWNEDPLVDDKDVREIYGDPSDEVLDRLDIARAAAYLPGEEEAFSLAYEEFGRRIEAESRAAINQRAARSRQLAALPTTPAWVRTLCERPGLQDWGFVCLVDPGAQQTDPQKMDDFQALMDGILWDAMPLTGTQGVLNHMIIKQFDAPIHAHVPRSEDDSDTKDGDDEIKDQKHDSAHDGGRDVDDDKDVDGAGLRKAFHDIMRQRAEKNIPDGLLTNTFLVIDRVCIDSVIQNPYGSRSHDEMRILAFESDYPQPGRTYRPGYRGWMWVRIEMLGFYFYELRFVRADEIGMDDLWYAAQASRNRAFASLDPVEAQIYSGVSPFDGILYRNAVELRRERLAIGYTGLE